MYVCGYGPMGRSGRLRVFLARHNPARPGYNHKRTLHNAVITKSNQAYGPSGQRNAMR